LHLIKIIFCSVLIIIQLAGCDSGGSLPKYKDPVLKLERIDITPSQITTQGVSELTLAAGNKQPFEAIGYYSDGSSREMENLSVDDWRTNNQKVGFFDAPGILTGGNIPGLVTIHVLKDGVASNKANVNVTAAVVTDITITDAAVTVAKGQTQQLTVMATYSDGTSIALSDSVSWKSSDVAVAKVTSGGLVTGLGTGVATLTAMIGGVISNEITVNVTAAVITDIAVPHVEVAVAEGQTQQLAVKATFSDGTSSDLSDSVTWKSDDTTVVEVMPGGYIKGVGVGNASIAVCKNGIRIDTVKVNVTEATITDITVTPSTKNIPKGQTLFLKAIATYSDDTFSDVSHSVAWMSDNTAVATVTKNGQLFANHKGRVGVIASKDGITSNTVHMNVTEAIITEITVTPATVGILIGQTEQLIATAIYSDGRSFDISRSVTWTSEDTAVATITMNGLLFANHEGKTLITAFKDDIISNRVNVNVKEAFITGIAVTPSPVNVAKGQTQQLVAAAIYSDDSSSDISRSSIWACGNTEVATVTSNGLLFGSHAGNTTVTATKDDITSDAVVVNVTAATITDIAVTPSPVNVAKGQTQQLSVMATYSDGTSSDVTSSVTWKSEDTATVTVTPSGLLSAVKAGSTTLTAIKDGIISNIVTVNVTSAVITDITVIPSPVNVAKGQTQQLSVMATYSDGTSSDVTSSVTWKSEDTATVTVTPSGLLSAVKAGSTTLTAIKDGIISNIVTVNVTSAVITDITVIPSLVNIEKGQTRQLSVKANYSDGTSSDVTSSVTWKSEDTATVTVTPSGLLSAVKLGSTTLTAIKDYNTSNTVTVNVVPPLILPAR
ncbi:Ig-like domain-containing protein, partial [Photobacterium leiognathi subsp. mandapamensis]